MRVTVKPSPQPPSGDTRAPVVANLHITYSAAHSSRRFCWLLVAGLHGLSVAYHGLMAAVYVHGGSLRAPFGPVRYAEQVTIDRIYFRTIGAGAGVLASAHVLFLARMVHSSIVARRLAFRIAGKRTSGAVGSHVGSLLSATSSVLRLHAKRLNVFSTRKTPKYLQPTLRVLSFVRFHLTHREGILGVDSPHFENVFFLRELFQIGFQSWQAWRMAERVPIDWLNHFNVVLVCLNCWSMPLLEWRLKRQRLKRQRQRVGPSVRLSSHADRLLTILVDCCLDSFAASLMSLAIFLPYLSMLNPDKTSFRAEFWLSDQWVVRTMNEFQIVFVVSWIDAISRAIFAVITMVSLQAVHDLSHDHFDQGTTPLQRNLTVKDSQKASRHEGVQSSRIHLLVRVGMVLWGCIIASLHTHASSMSSPQHCALPLRPWGVRKPACAVVIINCYRTGLTGSREGVESTFQAIASHYVSLIILQHCAALEMPRTLQTHNQLVSLRVHNATLVQWDVDAGLTLTTNPMLRALSFTRFTWPNGGQFPSDLFKNDPPTTVVQMSIQLSNLRSLPSDLHERLPQLKTFSCDLCDFETFPSTLLPMDPEFISLSTNKLTTLPITQLIASGRAAVVVGASFNPISSSIFDAQGLPAPEISPRLIWLALFNTSVASLPTWLTNRSVVAQGRLNVVLGGSPYCEGEAAVGIKCALPTIVDDVWNRIGLEDFLNPL